MSVRGMAVIAVALALTGTGPGMAEAQSLSERFAAAEPDKGAKVFNKCRACHTIEEGGPVRVGPNLWGAVGRPVAKAEDYSYSDALVAFGGVWTIDRLDAYLTNPRGLVPGAKMTFAGLVKPEDRANIIAYLNQNSTTPVDLVAAAAAAGETAQ